MCVRMCAYDVCVRVCTCVCVHRWCAFVDGGSRGGTVGQHGAACRSTSRIMILSEIMESERVNVSPKLVPVVGEQRKRNLTSTIINSVSSRTLLVLVKQ